MRFALVALLVGGIAFAGGCGDDEDPQDGGPSDGSSDASAIQCRSLPAVEGDGMAPRDANIDPADFDKAVNTAFEPHKVAQDDTRFALAVQAGAVKPASFMAWTRSTESGSSTTALTLRVWRELDGASGEVALVHEAQVMPGDGGFVHATVSDLAPATTYRYGFFVPGSSGGFDARSPLGTVRTAFADDMALALRIGAMTCSGSSKADELAKLVPFPALSKLAEEELDLLIHLGDVSYNDGSETLADYRRAWAQTLAQKGYRDVLPRAGMYVTWDDHEVDNNWDPEMISKEQLTAARDSYFEATATEGRAEERLWRSYRWGKTAEVFVLDLRGERLPSTLDSDSPVFVSDEQLQFLKDGLKASPAHFKLVMSSVQISNLHGTYDVPLGRDDRWEGYQTQREDLLNFIVTQEIDNVWFLAGDVHLGFVGRLDREGPYDRMWELTVGPTASVLPPIGIWLNEGLLKPNDIFPCDQFVFWHTRQQVATTLDLDPVANTIHIRYVDALTDEVLFDEVLQQEPRE